MLTNDYTNHYIVVSLSSSKPRVTRRCRDAEEAAAAAGNAGAGAVGAHKILLPAGVLRQVNAAILAARTWLYSATIQWGGDRIMYVSEDRLRSLESAQRALDTALDTARREFRAAYAAALADAPARLGAYYDRDDYLSPERAAETIRAEITARPLASDAGWQALPVPAGVAESLRQSDSLWQSQAAADAKKRVFDDLRAALIAAAERLAGTGKLYESTLTAPLAIAGLARDLDAAVPGCAAVAGEIERAIRPASESVDALRDSRAARAVAESAYRAAADTVRSACALDD